MRIKSILITLLAIANLRANAAQILIPMDDTQANHLKAYGIAYWVLQSGIEINWMLNYRGGSFMFIQNPKFESELKLRGVSYNVISEGQANQIVSEILDPQVNQDVVKLEKVPKICVYSPKDKRPWDDAVTLALTYAEIPYDVIYDEEIIQGKLALYDWMHLHHEDFTGQYGKFYNMYRNATWYQEQQRSMESMAKQLGFAKVSQMKLAVAKRIKEFVAGGGFLFTMCSGTDTYDIALSAEGLDICESMYDGDGTSSNYNDHLDFSKTFAFRDYTLSVNPLEYRFSNIDVTTTRRVPRDEDVFTLFDFSAKWDPVPTMLCFASFLTRAPSWCFRMASIKRPD